jgi:predicted lipoprotein with Yx(FWY)xxD motif
MKRTLSVVAALTTGSVIVWTALALGGTGTKPIYDAGANGRAAAGRPARAAANSAISVRRTPLGRILVDGNGRTLYLFERDRANKSNCANGCLSVWPAVTANAKPRARGGAVASQIGTIRRADGSRQVTYAKHPLYYYAGDTRPGQTKGQGLNQFGAKWYVLSSAGRKIDND